MKKGRITKTFLLKDKLRVEIFFLDENRKAILDIPLKKLAAFYQEMKVGNSNELVGLEVFYERGKILRA